MSALAVSLVLVLVLGANVVLLVMFAHLCSNVRAIKDAAETTARAVASRPIPPPYLGQR